MSIFSSLIPEAHLNHNSFDPSQRHVFSTKTGLIVPFIFKHTVPNAVYDLTVLDKIELNGMPRANFGRMSQQIDFFFVPYSQLWKPFDNAYYQRLDNVRNPGNVLNPLLPDAIPCFDFKDVLKSLWYQYFDSVSAQNIVDFLGRDAQYGDSTYTNLGLALDHAVEVGDLRIPTDVHGRWCIEDMLRNFDMMGYGNFLPIFQDMFKAVIVRDFGTISSDSDFIAALNDGFVNREFSDAFVGFQSDVLSAQFGTGSKDTEIDVYISDLFPSSAVLDAIFDLFWPAYSTKNYLPNAWPILAYLKIYNDYYKSFQYDTKNYAYYYNLDWLTNPSPSNLIPSSKILECLVPRYHLYKRDLFTGGYPNSQFGNVAVSFTDTDFHNLIGNNVDGSLLVAKKHLYADGDGSPVNISDSRSVDFQGGANKFKFDPALSVSVLALRQAEAMQRWKEKNLRAGDRISNQQKAMFGDRSRYVDDDYVRELGNTYTPIMIDDVTVTADSIQDDVARVGDKGSAGSSAHSNNVVRNFESHDFGVIVGVLYILPESEYEASGFDPMNIKTVPTDYFMPDFQNLGLAPVPNILFDNGVDNDEVVNYLSRYYEYKTAISKVHGEFNQKGAFGDYVTPRSKKDLAQLSLSSLQVAPFDTDNLFYQATNMYQSSDQFKINMNVVCRDILPMSITGLPY